MSGIVGAVEYVRNLAYGLIHSLSSEAALW
jgi:hypothetical protein